MFKVTPDIKRNKVIISFEGTVDLVQARDFYEDFKKALFKLKKGFVVLTDLSSLEKMNIEGHHYIEKAMDLCNQHGVSKIIRIIPDPTKDIGFNVMSLFHYSKDVIIHTFKSLEEAGQYLARDLPE